MPLYDYRCSRCGKGFEELAGADGPDPACPDCGGKAERLMGAGLGFRQDADWIESVLAVADKNSPAPHVRAFFANPGRGTYRAWMRGEGLRPLEPGEGRASGAGPGPGERIGREVLMRHKARKGLL